MSGGVIDTSKILEVTKLKVVFGDGAEQVASLRNVSFAIQANSFTIIYGPSGSGKSTLLNVMGGLLSPTEGSVDVQGQDIYRLSRDELAHFRANRIGFVHQTNYWVKSLNVVDNLAIPLYALGYGMSKANRLAMNALDRVNMADFAKKNPAVLSGGEQQRIAMARALVNEPLIIIADEPTGNLDTVNGDNLMKLLLNCQTEFRRTIILVTHNMEYIPFAEHLLHIHDGLVEDIGADQMATVTNGLLEKTRQRIGELEKIKREAVRE
ncbi:ABC transporter ATP-binding protein [bacterium]|nr:MAG: ABC transporter ATP-binding protein [bacterium]